MRLRNRQTDKVYTLGENLYIEYTQGGKIEVRAIIPGGNMSYYYDSLDKLNEEWEDYKPAEPLIKDEKIRKAVRAWAEAIEANEVIISHSRHDYLKIIDLNADCDICFDYEIGYTYNETNYTITELCGEEEE